jgi:hypothetical protein
MVFWCHVCHQGGVQGSELETRRLLASCLVNLNLCRADHFHGQDHCAPRKQEMLMKKKGGVPLYEIIMIKTKNKKNREESFICALVAGLGGNESNQPEMVLGDVDGIVRFGFGVCWRTGCC